MQSLDNLTADLHINPLFVGALEFACKLVKEQKVLLTLLNKLMNF